MAEPAPESALIPDPMRTRLGWGVFWGAWTVLALFFALQARLSASIRGGSRPWSEAWIIGGLDAYTWGLLALAAFWMARRLPPDTGRWPRIVGIHLGVAVLLVVVRLEFFSFVGPLLIPASTPSHLTSFNRLVIAFPTNLLVYLTLVGVGYTLEYFRRYRNHELAAARLEAQVANADLQLLTTQLQPRFLFTTLRTISGLMHRDVRAADRTLALLGDLLRGMLQRGVQQTVSLREEVEFLELYLEIEQLRFGDRLQVSWDVEPEVLDASVPHLVLQPLVANAIRGGSGSGVAIRAWAEADRLEIEVCGSHTNAEGDWQPGRLASKPLSRNLPEPHGIEQQGEGDAADAGLGLVNAQARLSQLYGADHAFRLETLADGGMRIRISIPLHLDSALTRPVASQVAVEVPA